MVEMNLLKGYHTIVTLHLWFPSEVNPTHSGNISSNMESVFQISKLLCIDRLCSSLAALKTASCLTLPSNSSSSFRDEASMNIRKFDFRSNYTHLKTFLYQTNAIYKYRFNQSPNLNLLQVDCPQLCSNPRFQGEKLIVASGRELSRYGDALEEEAYMI